VRSGVRYSPEAAFGCTIRASSRRQRRSGTTTNRSAGRSNPARDSFLALHHPLRLITSMILFDILTSCLAFCIEMLFVLFFEMTLSCFAILQL
jgi:hypothetical protein